MEKISLINLNWNASIEDQQKAINELSEMTYLNPNILVQPLGKECWENAARVLSMIGYPRIQAAIPGLFSWLQDMNWPGAMQVMELLKSLPKDVIIQHLETAASKALNTDDEIWLTNLSTFLDSFNLHERDFISKKVYDALVNSDEF